MLLFLFLLLGSASAVDVVWERVDVDRLEHGAVDVAEDAEGFLWFATRRGLVRFDGERTVLVTPADRQLSTHTVVVALGRVWTSTRAGSAYVLDDGALTQAIGADGEPLMALRIAGTADALWTYDGEQIWRLDKGGVWTEHTPPDWSNNAGVYHLRVDGDGVFIASNLGLWRVGADGSSALIRSKPTQDAARLSDGRLAVHGQDTVLIDDGVETVLLPHQNKRARWLRVRDDVIYMGYGDLYRITPDGRWDTYTHRSKGGPPIGETGFVAADGTLWTGNISLPEPDSLVWGPDEQQNGDGRWITVSPDGVVHHSTWGGYDRLEAGGPIPAGPFAIRRPQQVCVDGAGRALGFSGSPGGPDMVDQTAERVVVPGVWGSGCTSNERGGVWMVGPSRLWEVDGDSVAERPAPNVAAAHRGVAQTADGVLIVVGGTSACEASVADLRADADDPWTCTDLGEVVGPNIVCAIEAAPGLVWACTEGDGLWARSAPGQWAPAKANQSLEVREVITATHSDSGGVWLDQGGEMVRLVQSEDQWRVAERANSQVGVPPSAVDIDEDAQGNLWVATGSGAAFVPAHRRLRQATEPRPRLVSALVDGAPSEPPLQVPNGSAVELQFAAFDYRQVRDRRYRWRIGDGSWSSPARSGTIRLAGLASGDLRVAVSATIDGRNWSEPVVVEVSVLPAWYERPWVWLLAGLLVVAAVWLVQRLRARVAIEAERQRARIAMDLHDELGAGLGSISILAGLLASDRVPAARARDAAKRIAASAEELGGSVTDIVWSLRTSSHDLTTLTTYLQDRARNLLDLDNVRLRHDLPNPLPVVALRPNVARAAQLVMVEALHNAARHSGATTVVIRVLRDGTTWSVAVADNGVGLDGGPETRMGGGSGLDNMKRRADQVGAVLVITSSPETGTEVRLTLPG